MSEKKAKASKSKTPVVKTATPLEPIKEVYTYQGEGSLVMDKPSQPLTVKPPKPPKPFSNKTTFYALATEGPDFTLRYKGATIYSTEGKLAHIFKDLSFEDDYFTLYGVQYPYDGLSLHYKR